VAGTNDSTILDSPHLGHLWETFVLSELRKSLFLRHPEATLWFYRDQQKEADFVISYGSKLYLLDAKSGRKFRLNQPLRTCEISRAISVRHHQRCA
jgi:predicted AAA+ superfamily ATPase